MSSTQEMQQTGSRASLLASLPEAQRAEILAQLTETEKAELLHDWAGFWARPDQIPPPGDWFVWLIQTGRGWGKTRTGAEFVRGIANRDPTARIALIAPTAADVRAVMVNGESGLLNIGPAEQRPTYEPSKRLLTWPNGAQAETYSADEPNRLRGPQHTHAWCDELAAWRYMRDAWDQLLFGLRLGSDPRVVVTTTPRPVTLLREIAAGQYGTCHMTRGRMLDNQANLAPHVVQRLIDRYGGTRLGRQELDGEYLEDVEGALWHRGQIDAARTSEAPDLARIVVAIDPAVTSGAESDETGIIAAGRGVDGEGYVLHDVTCRLSPEQWCRRAVNLYHELQADMIVAEVNNGGDLVETVLRTVDRNVPFKAVHASRGKRTRAEPIAALYEQGRVHHVGALPDLEDQMCSYVPDNFDGSPDRVDALVWALTDLMLDATEITIDVF